MLAGMSREEKQALDLTAASDYVYLNQVEIFSLNIEKKKKTTEFEYVVGWNNLL